MTKFNQNNLPCYSPKPGKIPVWLIDENPATPPPGLPERYSDRFIIGGAIRLVLSCSGNPISLIEFHEAINQVIVDKLDKKIRNIPENSQSVRCSR